MQSIKCPKCGQPIFEDAYVCVHCQTKINTCVNCHHKTVSGTACPKCKTPYPEHFLTEVTEDDLHEEKERIAQWEKFNTKSGVEEKNIFKRWKERSGLNKFLGYSSRLVHALLLAAGLFVGMLGLVVVGRQSFENDPMRALMGMAILCIAGVLVFGYSAKTIALYIVAPLQMAKMATKENLNFIKSYVKLYYDKQSEGEIFSMECTLYAAMLMTNRGKYLPFIILAAIKRELAEIGFCLLGIVMALIVGFEEPPQIMQILAIFLWNFSFYYVLLYTGCATLYCKRGWKLFFIIYGFRSLRGVFMRKMVRGWYGTYFPESYYVGTNRQYCIKYR